MAITTAKGTTTTVAMFFLKHWVSIFGIPTKVITGNEPKLTSKMFTPICTWLGVKVIKNIEYHHLASEQIESFNQTVVPTWPHYVADHRKDWDAFVPPLTYAYNAQVYWPKNPSPLRLFHTGKLLGPAIICSPTTASTLDANSAL